MSLEDVNRLIHKAEVEFPHFLLNYIASSILKALYHCQSNRILHSDVKPSNVLFCKRGAQVKLCDFGESITLSKEGMTNEAYVGTIAYWPPERFQNKTTVLYDHRTDVWGLGVTLLELLLGYNPFLEVAQGDLITVMAEINNFVISELIKKVKIREPHYGKVKEFNEDIQSILNSEVYRFIMRCLTPIGARPTYDELMKTIMYERIAQHLTGDAIEVQFYGFEVR